MGGAHTENGVALEEIFLYSRPLARRFQFTPRCREKASKKNPSVRRCVIVLSDGVLSMVCYFMVCYLMVCYLIVLSDSVLSYGVLTCLRVYRTTFLLADLFDGRCVSLFFIIIINKYPGVKITISSSLSGKCLCRRPPTPFVYCCNIPCRCSDCVEDVLCTGTCGLWYALPLHVRVLNCYDSKKRCYEYSIPGYQVYFEAYITVYGGGGGGHSLFVQRSRSGSDDDEMRGSCGV